MPPRIGPNGAVVKPSSTKSQRTARPIASQAIDLTRESTDETSENSSGEEEESEDVSNGGRGHQNSSASAQGRTSGAGQAPVGRPKPHDHQRMARRGQEDILEDSFIVTSLHHRPWGAGDDSTTVGVFSTEREAKVAADMDFERCASQADGWESEWRRLARDGMLQLRGWIEEGEKDSETYQASIKRVQQKRPVAVQSSVPSAAQPKPRVAKPRHVYLVKEEQRINVGEDDPQGLYNDLGDLKALQIHGIYVDLDTANGYAREVYDSLIESLSDIDTVTDTLENSMVRILIADQDEMMTYSISVEQRRLN